MSVLPPRDSIYLQHVLDAILRIESYLVGMDEERFLTTPLVQDAVIRQLQIIGEATKRLSADARMMKPEISWRQIAGMRDKLTHDYMGTDLKAVWRTTRSDLHPLRRAVEGMLRDLAASDGF